MFIHICFDITYVYSILHAMRAIVCNAHDWENTVLPLHYFGNYGSFIRFISIIVFVSLLGGRPMNAPTDTHILLYIIWSGNTDFHFAIHIPDHNFQLSIFNFQLNCVYQYTIILIQNYIRIKTFSSIWQAFFRHLYIRL